MSDPPLSDIDFENKMAWSGLPLKPLGKSHTPNFMKMNCIFITWILENDS